MPYLDCCSVSNDGDNRTSGNPIAQMQNTTWRFPHIYHLSFRIESVYGVSVLFCWTYVASIAMNQWTHWHNCVCTCYVAKYVGGDLSFVAGARQMHHSDISPFLDLFVCIAGCPRSLISDYTWVVKWYCSKDFVNVFQHSRRPPLFIYDGFLDECFRTFIFEYQFISECVDNDICKLLLICF